jgi:acetylornithine/N-succinyldiaminopimelate aminotransferase
VSKKDFYQYQAQTTNFAIGLEIKKAKGNYIYDTNGKAYLDFAAGVSVNTLGHSHPKVNKAIISQVKKHLHVMVYGEYIQKIPVKLCKMLAKNTPEGLETTYLVNSGAEAIDGALKLAKRYTGRQEIIAFHNSYHGNTHGALSVTGNDYHKEAFKPLLPEIEFIHFNQEENLQKITKKTAAVIVETIQGAAGFILPTHNYLKKLKEKCESVGALLILDEIQPGFGRTGKLFAFEWFGIIPDILVMGKGMANGLPIGAFMSSYEKMEVLRDHPKLGHITTFGGNPVIASAALATLKELKQTDLIKKSLEKESLFRELLVHPKIKAIHGKGLMLAVQLTEENCIEIAKKCQDKGLIIFWLLYRKNYLRITPPLTITKNQIKKGCKIILEVLNQN